MYGKTKPFFGANFSLLLYPLLPSFFSKPTQYRRHKTTQRSRWPTHWPRRHHPLSTNTRNPANRLKFKDFSQFDVTAQGLTRLSQHFDSHVYVMCIGCTVFQLYLDRNICIPCTCASHRVENAIMVSHKDGVLWKWSLTQGTDPLPRKSFYTNAIMLFYSCFQFYINFKSVV